MTLTDIITIFQQAGFTRTHLPTSFPLTIHGVPGSGKSTALKQLLNNPDIFVCTLGKPYGDSLTTPGVQAYDPDTNLNHRFRVLDEYQHADSSVTARFNVLVGDPYQGAHRFEPHLIKEFSHRVPRPVTHWLHARGFQISSTKPGSLTTANPFQLPQNHSYLTHTLIHLGPVSHKLCLTHNLHTHCPYDLAGAEFDNVTIIAHSSEFSNRPALYIATTRAKTNLIILSDAFNELSTTT